MTDAPPLVIPAYLVAAMRANPADDGLRLQVADFFDENGQPERAEFVRLQIELVREMAAMYEYDRKSQPFNLYRQAEQNNRRARIPGLLAREKKLFDAAAGPITDPTFTSPYLKFDRGFVSKVECPAAAWLHAGDAIYAREPVTEVTLTTWPALYTYRRPGETTYRVSLDVNDAVGYLIQHDIITRATGERALADRWPGVKFALPPELRAGIQLRAGILMGQVTAEGEAEDTPPDHGTADRDAAESMSAAPPDSARRRGGHSRMPGWLAERRSRPGRR